MTIKFAPHPTNPDFQFIEKEEDMSCTLKYKGDTWRGQIKTISSTGTYTIELIEKVQFKEKEIEN